MSNESFPPLLSHPVPSDDIGFTGEPNYGGTNETIANDTELGTVTDDASVFDDKLDGDMSHVYHEPEGTKVCNFFTLWSYVGPGWLMAIANLDPGNLVSDLQAGAYTGYQLLWVLTWATCFGWACQVFALMLGAITGKDLAQLCRERYPRPISLLLWVLMELVIIGNDIQQIIGSAVAFRILFGLPLWAGSLITAIDTFTFLGFQYFGIRKLEAFFASLVFGMCICFFINFGVMDPPAAEIAEGVFVPKIESYATMRMVGLLGSLLMPHNFFLHSASVAARKIKRESPFHVREAIKYFSIDAALALFMSLLINLAVISVFAAGFFRIDCARQELAWVPDPTLPEGGSCKEIGLLNAGSVLQATLKGSAEKVWAVGLLAAGQAATMTGTFAGQYIMEGFLEIKLPKWKRIILTRVVALFPAVFVALAAQRNEGLQDIVDEWINVLQCVALPFALFPVLHFIASDSVLGGRDFIPGRFRRGMVWFLALLVITANFYLLATDVLSGMSKAVCFIFGMISVYYLKICYALVETDILAAYAKVKSCIQCTRQRDTHPQEVTEYLPIESPQPTTSVQIKTQE